MRDVLTPVIENLSVRVASTGAFGGLLSGSIEAFGALTGAACLPGVSRSDVSAQERHSVLPQIIPVCAFSLQRCR